VSCQQCEIPEVITTRGIPDTSSPLNQNFGLDRSQALISSQVMNPPRLPKNRSMPFFASTRTSAIWTSRAITGIPNTRSPSIINHDFYHDGAFSSKVPSLPCNGASTLKVQISKTSQRPSSSLRHQSRTSLLQILNEESYNQKSVSHLGQVR
jgi:hypothetical protein